MLDDENTAAEFEETAVSDEDADVAEDVMNDTDFEETEADVQESENDEDVKTEAKSKTEDKKVVEKEERGKPAKKYDAIDSVFAKARRESDDKDTERKVREKYILEATGGKNPFTHEEMKDTADVDEFLLMRKIEKAGGDPVADYPKWLKDERRAAAEAKTKIGTAEFIEKDRADFVRCNPSIDLAKLIDDKRFNTFAKARIGTEPLADIYNDYIGFISEFEIKAEKEAQKIDAKRKASPGPLSSTSTPDAPDVEKMSVKDFEKILERVKGGEKITLPN